MTIDTHSLNRLFKANEHGERPSLGSHLELHGPLPSLRAMSSAHRRDLLHEVEGSGLGGRGGAGFPTFRKLALYKGASSRPMLIVNATEGEPASFKDRALLTRAPHLVLDGAEMAATIIGATRIVICISQSANDPARVLEQALIERERSGRTMRRIDVARTPEGFTSGEESSLLNFVSTGAALPFFRRAKSVPLERRGLVALVQNAETLAHLALIARHGADWFRSVGRSGETGTCLVSLSGAVEHPGVYEIAFGTPVVEALDYAIPTGPLQAVLIGGYGGGWVSGELLDTPFAPGPLRELSAAPGAGVLIALSTGSCGLAETARIANYLASQSAGQCGPCVFGLRAIAQDLATLARGRGSEKDLERLSDRLDLISGRGACAHPDGAVRLVRSALKVFAHDLDTHRRGRQCAGTLARSVLRFETSNTGHSVRPRRDGLLAAAPQLLDAR